jgi:hypothetical protein
MDLFDPALQKTQESRSVPGRAQARHSANGSHAGRVRRTGKALLLPQLMTQADRGGPTVLLHDPMGVAGDEQNHPTDGDS